MKYQNKEDNNWQLTSNNYPCWHNTFFSFFVLLFLSCTVSGSTGPASLCRLSFLCGPVSWTEQDRSCMSVRFVPLCFSLCFYILPFVPSNFCVHSCFSCQLQYPNRQTILWRRTRLKYHCQQQ